jgi:hypothetical protein
VPHHGHFKETALVPIVVETGEPQGRSGRVWREENLLPSPGFESQTVQPIVSHCPNYAISAPICDMKNNKTKLMKCIKIMECCIN